MITYREFTSFINDELVRVGNLFTEKQQQYSAVFPHRCIAGAS